MRQLNSRALSVLLLLALVCVFSPFMDAQEVTSNEALVGVWVAQEDYFPPVILFEEDEVGGLVAYLTGSDQIARTNPFSEVTVRGDSVILKSNRPDIVFRGALTDGAPPLVGTWTQSYGSARLTLFPAEDVDLEVLSRPQEPEPPFPYVAEEVTFLSEPSGIELAGTVTRPEGSGPFPGVVLVFGTGPGNRDGEIVDHKPFLVLADYLTRHGIAVLRYDERGVADSEGNFEGASLDDFSRDAAAALRFLKERSYVDASQSGFVGHSMGGLTGLLANDQYEDAAFLVLLATPSLPGHQGLVEQEPRTARAAGASEAEIDSLRTTMRQRFEVIGSEVDSVTAAEQLRALFEEQGVPDEMIESYVKGNTQPWWRDLVRLDPRPVLQEVDVPILVLYGDKDLSVPPDQNTGPMRAALSESPSEEVTIRVIDGLNHWLQPAETGFAVEISQIQTTIAPEALEAIDEWIRARVAVSE